MINLHAETFLITFKLYGIPAELVNGNSMRIIDIHVVLTNNKLVAVMHLANTHIGLIQGALYYRLARVIVQLNCGKCLPGLGRTDSH